MNRFLTTGLLALSMAALCAPSAWGWADVHFNLGLGFAFGWGGHGHGVAYAPPPPPPCYGCDSGYYPAFGSVVPSAPVVAAPPMVAAPPVVATPPTFHGSVAPVMYPQLPTVSPPATYQPAGSYGFPGYYPVQNYYPPSTTSGYYAFPSVYSGY